MPNRELSQALERLHQAHARVEGNQPGAFGSTMSAEARLGLSFAPGDRIFDRVRGVAGVVVAGFVPVGARGAVVSVRLDDGALVSRAPDELERRPTPPTPAK